MRRFIPLLLAFLLCSCSTDGAVAEKKTKLKIGVALYKQDDTFIGNLINDFQEFAKQKETDAEIIINIDIADGKGSQSLQNDQIDRFFAQGCDVVCVNLVDRTVAAVIVDKAKRAGIPVIFFNREPVEEDMHRWNMLYYIGATAELSGEIQGKIVVDCYKREVKAYDFNGDGKLQYVMLEGEPGHQDALIRTENSVKAVTDAGVRLEKLANQSANWQRAQASSIVSQWLERFGDSIEVIFSNNDDMALGAIDALEDAGITRFPLIVGVDGTPQALEALKEGKLTGTAMQDTEGQARSMLELSYALACGLEPEDELPELDGKYVYYPYYEVTAENVGEFTK